MAMIKVNKEFQPERCEICHQKDLFDANNNYCERCNKQKTSVINIRKSKFFNNKVEILNYNKITLDEGYNHITIKCKQFNITNLIVFIFAIIPCINFIGKFTGMVNYWLSVFI